MATCRMNDMLHIPVLLHEAVNALVTNPDGVYIDATFGRGSHAEAILHQLTTKGRLIAFDRDQSAVQYATQFIRDPRFQIIHAPFSQLLTIIDQYELRGKIAGILFDLGVSSPQLDDPARGFSFIRDGQLDMRMDTTTGIDAKTWLASVDEKTLADVLWRYGEERFSRQIAKRIVNERKITPILTTKVLADIIKSAIPGKSRSYDKHPATQSFQAIRIAINHELQELEEALSQVLEILSVRGRLVVISFHSLEDRIVKNYIRVNEKGEPLPRGLPIKSTTFQQRLQSVGKRIKPTDSEIAANPRARSAILRIAEKTL